MANAAQILAKFGADDKEMRRAVGDTLKGFNDIQNKAASASAKVGSALKSAGDGMQKAGKALTKYVTLPAVGAATALGGIALKKGWDRISNIHGAQKKLAGLGMSAKDVSALMDDALSAVRGTSYGMGDAAKAAAMASAAGVKAGKDMKKYLGTVADAAALTSASLDEIGMIYGKVQSKGKASARELNQLMERGIPIYDLLAESLGVSVEKVQELTSKGKIGMTELQGALEKYEGAAIKMGDPLENFWAAVSRIGEAFWGSALDGEGFFFTIQELAVKATEWMDGIIPYIKVIGKAFDEVIKAVIEIFGKLGSELSDAGEDTRTLEEKVADFAEKVAEIKDKVIEVFEKLAEKIKVLKEWWDKLSPATQDFIKKAVLIAPLLGPALTIFGKLTSGVGSVIGMFGKFGGAASKVGSSVGGAMSGMGSTVGNALAGLINGLGAAGAAVMGNIPQLAALALAFVALGAAIWAFWALAGEAIKDFVRLLVEVAKEVIPVLVEAINELIQGSIIPLAEAIGDFLLDAICIAADAIIGIIDTMGNAIFEVLDAIAYVFEWMVATASEAIIKLGNTIVRVVDSIARAFMTAGDAIANILNATGRVIRTFGDVVVDIINAAGGFVDTLATSFDKMGGTGVKVLDKVAETAERTASAIVSIIDAVGRLITKLGQVKFPKPPSFLSALGFSQGGLVPSFASGGYITGRGTSTSDGIAARLSAGEFVMRASAVKRIGAATLTALNEGGAVGRQAPVVGTINMAAGTDPLALSQQIARRIRFA